MIPTTPSSAPTYYTYLKAAQAAVGKDAPGSGVRFAAGKGYYVGAKPPVARRPAASPQPSHDPFAALTLPQLQAAAAAQVAAEMAAERAPIISAQQKAAREALAQEQAATGFSNAAYGAIQNATSGLGSAYDQAKATMGGLGLSGEAAPFAQFDQNELSGDQNAVNTWAGQLGQVQGAQGREDVTALIAAQQKQDVDYEQQLIDLAAKEPSMRADALNELYKLEISKEGVRQDEANMAIKQRAERLYELQYGEKVAHDASLESQGQARIDQGQQRINLQNKRDQASVDAAAAKGQLPNAALSAKYGYIVDAHGRPILNNGKKIKVAKTSGSAANPQKVYGQAVKGAKSILGSPMTYSGNVLLQSGDTSPKGKYIAADGAKGVFSQPLATGGYVRTTNDPNKAKFDTKYTFADALDYLISAYPGLNRAQARKALIAAGWKPDGKRPAPAGAYRVGGSY